MSSGKLSENTVKGALNCVQACRDDPLEPERYREWYSETYDELKAFTEANVYEEARALAWIMFFAEDPGIRHSAAIKLRGWAAYDDLDV